MTESQRRISNPFDAIIVLSHCYCLIAILCSRFAAVELISSLSNGYDVPKCEEIRWDRTNNKYPIIDPIYWTSSGSDDNLYEEPFCYKIILSEYVILDYFLLFLLM